MMSRKTAIWSLWVGFLVYIFLLAPPAQPSTVALLKNLFTGNWTEINPCILSLFSLVGIWLVIYSCLMFIDGRMQKIPAWPFLLTSVVTGVIGLTPYLALRDSNQAFSGEKDRLIKLFDSRFTGIILAFSTVVILAYGLLLGDWGNFIYQFQTSRFVNGMTIAFCLFCLLFPALLGDDMARRNWQNSTIFWLVSLVPLIGPLSYLCLRPALPETNNQSSSASLYQQAVTSSKR